MVWWLVEPSRKPAAFGSSWQTRSMQELSMLKYMMIGLEQVYVVFYLTVNIALGLILKLNLTTSLSLKFVCVDFLCLSVTVTWCRNITCLLKSFSVSLQTSIVFTALLNTLSPKVTMWLYILFLNFHKEFVVVVFVEVLKKKKLDSWFWYFKVNQEVQTFSTNYDPEINLFCQSNQPL